MDIGAIQQMAFTLLKSLTGFDAGRIVQEKQEDGAAIEAAGNAIAHIGRTISATAADGIVTGAEASAMKAAAMDAMTLLKAAGVEILDQDFNDVDPGGDGTDSPSG